jgi:hypothetical protein
MNSLAALGLKPLKRMGAEEHFCRTKLHPNLLAHVLESFGLALLRLCRQL